MKKKQSHKTKQEVRVELDEEAERVVDKNCAEELEAVLKKYSRAIQPFLHRNDYTGDSPRVRLVRVTPPEEKKDEEIAA